MRFFYTLLGLTLLIVFQSTLLPVIVPWLPLNPTFLFLVVLSFRLDRTLLLLAGLWAGLVQDVLLGEMLGLFMMANFIALAVIWELKEELLEDVILTCGLRVVVATLIHEVLMSFIYYIRGLEVARLLYILQLNAGITLLSNLVLYILLLAWLRTRGSGKIGALLEARR
jgi:rod shape-determining protein MreD